jgi:hypothetical protein
MHWPPERFPFRGWSLTKSLHPVFPCRAINPSAWLASCDGGCNPRRHRTAPGSPAVFRPWRAPGSIRAPGPSGSGNRRAACHAGGSVRADGGGCPWVRVVTSRLGPVWPRGRNEKEARPQHSSIRTKVRTPFDDTLPPVKEWPQSAPQSSGTGRPAPPPGEDGGQGGMASLRAFWSDFQPPRIFGLPRRRGSDNLRTFTDANLWIAISPGLSTRRVSHEKPRIKAKSGYPSASDVAGGQAFARFLAWPCHLNR